MGAAADQGLLASLLTRRPSPLMEPNIDGLNVFDDGSAERPQNPSDWQGRRHRLDRPLQHNSRLAKRRLLRKLADKRAPW